MLLPVLFILGAAAWAYYADDRHTHNVITRSKVEVASSVLKRIIGKYEGKKISDFSIEDRQIAANAMRTLACPEVAESIEQGIRLEELPKDKLARVKLELKSLEARGIDI